MNPITTKEIEEQFLALPFDIRNSFLLSTTYDNHDIRHRGKVIRATCCAVGRNLIYDGIPVVILTLEEEEGWLIVPNLPSDEKFVDDLGPFRTLEEVFVFAALVVDR